jgi:hypothetical protein
MRVGAESWSTGISTELDTHGREAALSAPFRAFDNSDYNYCRYEIWRPRLEDLRRPQQTCLHARHHVQGSNGRQQLCQ